MERTPPEMTEVFGWMVLSITADAGAAMFSRMRDAMPPPMCAGILQFARSVLAPRDAAKLDRALDA